MDADKKIMFKLKSSKKDGSRIDCPASVAGPDRIPPA
jgi:hypothetical protein